MKKLVLGLTAVFALATSVPAMADEAPAKPAKAAKKGGKKEGGKKEEGKGEGKGKHK